MPGATGPAPTDPVSPLIGSPCCSLTSKSPELVDHLVTFIACEIVTGRGLTEILGTLPNCNLAHAALRQFRTAPFAQNHFPTNMGRPTSQKAGDGNGDREMHQSI
jgi:hypothetical protein